MIRLLKVLGGPLDGAVIPMAEGVEEFGYRDGHALHIYAVGESYEGPKVQAVLREVQVVPWPFGSGSGE